jgi:protein TonB
MAQGLFFPGAEGDMALAAPLVPRETPQESKRVVRVVRTPRFEDLVCSAPPRRRTGGRVTAVVSLAIHAIILSAVVIIPLLTEDFLPESDRAVRAFFVTPADAPPPPPPPPPPAAGARAVTRTPVAPRPLDEAPRFVAPIEIPDEVKPEEGLSLGVEGGVPGGVEGGVPGGVLGGIVGGIVEVPTAAPEKIVRVGGNIHAPKLITKVNPEYPPLAVAARVGGLLILEAQVGTDGRVKAVTVLRGQPLLDQAAIEAVKQWRYKPLLLNGQPTPFILTVTLTFHLTTDGRAPSGS